VIEMLITLADPTSKDENSWGRNCFRDNIDNNNQYW
jgi:hypothetical protein